MVAVADCAIVSIEGGPLWDGERKKLRDHGSWTCRIVCCKKKVTAGIGCRSKAARGGIKYMKYPVLGCM